MAAGAGIVINQDTVSKLFDVQASYERELRVYQADLPHVPELIASGKTDQDTWFITCRRVMGEAYLDTEDFSAAGLGKALAEFHQASLDEEKCLCHIDNQPQNILLAGSDYYFVDFSDSREDFPEVDLSHLLLFWAEEYRLGDFRVLVESFLASYEKLIKLNATRWKDSLRQNIKVFEDRRARHGKSVCHCEDSRQNRDWLARII